MRPPAVPLMEKVTRVPCNLVGAVFVVGEWRAQLREARSAQRSAWMVRAQTGDIESYRALLDDIGPVVLGFLAKRLACREDVEDAYQDTFLALHRARHTYQPSRALEPWLLAIARNVAADYGRRRRRRAAREVLFAAVPEPAIEPERGSCAELEQVMRLLPATQREALEMLKLKGLSVAEAAARAGTTTGALRVRAHRAYVALRAALRV